MLYRKENYENVGVEGGSGGPLTPYPDPSLAVAVVEKRKLRKRQSNTIVTTYYAYKVYRYTRADIFTRARQSDGVIVGGDELLCHTYECNA